MKRSLLTIYSLLSLIFVLAVTSCKDDPLYDPDDFGDGVAIVSAEVSFKPLTSGLDSRATGGTPGNAIKSFARPTIFVFDKNHNFVRRIAGSELTNYNGNLKNDKTPGDAVGSNEHQAEKETQKSTFNLPALPFGRYYMYVVANVPDEKLSGISTEDDLKGLVLDWNSGNVAANNQMFGYFTDGDQDKSVGFDASLVTLKNSNVTLKAWIKRAASKVTVAFDGRKLKNNVTIYLKKVEIKDIPAHCYLGKNNEPGKEGLPDEMDELIRNGQTITYQEGNTYDQSWRPQISNGRPVYGLNSEALDAFNKKDEHTEEEIAQQIKLQHEENVTALYFYENMQGKGNTNDASNKHQVVDQSPDNKDPNRPTYPNGGEKDENGNFTNSAGKDTKKYGTYIEVTAYYNSANMGDVTSGNIVYRFMLGKDTETDFNAQRNYHYKLTLCFNGYANDVDWHIEYDRPKDIDIPVPYYISYLYNHMMYLPVQLYPEDGYNLVSVESKIISNNWAPEGQTEKNYWSPMNHPEDDAYAYNGFLSVRQTQDIVIPSPATWPYDANKSYYDAQNRGKRTYSFSQKGAAEDGGNWYTDEGDSKTDVYFMKETTIDGHRAYQLRLPMYTRAKQMIKQTGYTGNNPFVAYQRYARVSIKANYKDKDGHTITKEFIPNNENGNGNKGALIRQVRRVVNPKGIYRSAGPNPAPFHVTLMYQPGEENDFEPLSSQNGPWRAFIVRQSGNGGISIRNANKEYSMSFQGQTVSTKAIEGSTGSNISFYVDFKGLTSNTTNNYAVIRVEYHNYSCVHLIFVRQGDVPDRIGTGTTYWHAHNMRTKTKECDSPLDEGSLFKYNNWSQPIDAMSNKNGFEYGIIPTPDDFEKNAATLVKGGKTTSNDLYIATDNGKDKTTTTWAGISNTSDAGFTNPTTGTRVATLEDFKQLYKDCTSGKGDINKFNLLEQGYGVCYGDDSSETLTDIEAVYGYDYENTNRGMRGIFVYDTQNGKNLFFPIGASGYGHRKNELAIKDVKVTWPTFNPPTSNPVAQVNPISSAATNSSASGVLRYMCNGRWGYFDAVSSKYVNAVNSCPLFYDLFRRQGGVYWLGRVASDTDNMFNDSDAKNNIIAWDINYYTFDFYPITTTNIPKTDACFVRCVND